MKGADIRKLRERNQWSQADLATAINAALGRNYGSGSVSPWERDKRPIPPDVAAFLEELSMSTALPPDDERDVDPLAGERDADVAADSPPFDPDAPAPQPVLHAGSDTYERACRELWELVASGIGMVGAATGSPTLMRDGEIIQADSAALGEAWGKLARENETFRRMLVGMTSGGAWLQVAMVTGTTASKCWQSHSQYALMVTEQAGENGNLGIAAEREAA